MCRAPGRGVCGPAGIMRRAAGIHAGLCRGLHSYSTNPIIWGCIFYVFTGKIFANLLMFHPLFLAAHLLSIKIVSQKAEKCNHIPCLLLNYLLCVPVTSVTVNCRE